MEKLNEVDGTGINPNLDKVQRAREEFDSKIAMPEGYVEVVLSTRGRIGAPAKFYIRNFSPEDLMSLGLADKEDVPLKLYLFDLLYFKNSMIDEPLVIRRKTLEKIVNTSTEQINLSKMIIATPENIDEAVKLFNESISKGHEGIMIKNPTEPYIPGLRGKKMLKFKAEPETLDVVVVGGTYGIGKRANFVGSYKVALKGEEENKLKEVAHVATGLDDETLAKLTKLMDTYKISSKGTKIKVKPRIILEIAYSEIVKSPEYEAGYSLRFPVVKRIREDKSLADIDTVERLKSMFKGW